MALLPGLLCDATVWAGQRQALGATHAVVTPDFLGQDSITRMAEWVLRGAPARFSLAGHSMGARVALEVVRLAPERIERLALLDTGAHPVRAGELAARQALVDLAYAEGMGALAARWLPPMVAHDRVGDAALMEPLTRMVERATPQIFEGQIRALLNRPDTAPAMAAVRCPTAVIVGRHDAWSPVDQHEAIVAEIPGSRLTVIENAGHMAPVEEPQAVAAVLAEWLRS